jgi:hypothetical protein
VGLLGFTSGRRRRRELKQKAAVYINTDGTGKAG